MLCQYIGIFIRIIPNIYRTASLLFDWGGWGGGFPAFAQVLADDGGFGRADSGGQLFLGGQFYAAYGAKVAGPTPGMSSSRLEVWRLARRMVW